MVDNEVSRQEMNAVGRRAAERSLAVAPVSMRMYSSFAYLSAANANDSWNMFYAWAGAAARKNARIANIKTDTDNRHGDTIKKRQKRSEEGMIAAFEACTTMYEIQLTATAIA